MGKRLYVGNLPYGMDEERLKAAFEEFGFSPTSTFIVRDRENGNQSKGFGFVELPTDTDAANAISQLNGARVDGRTLRVDQANERPPRQGQSWGDSGGGGGRGRDRRDRNRD